MRVEPVVVASLLLLAALPLVLPLPAASAGTASSGERLPDPPEGADVWWALSSAKRIRPDQTAPEKQGRALRIRCARNETDAAQVVVRPRGPLLGFRIRAGALLGADGARIEAENLEVLRVGYVDVTHPTDGAPAPGRWPDPLLPIAGPLDLDAGASHAFWIRLSIPRAQPAGAYRGAIALRAEGFHTDVPVEVTVYDFTLPDRMTCTTAFGFSAPAMFRYHRLKTGEQKRLVLDKYLADMAAHQVSPYDPAPLDPIRVRWPDVRPPRTVWDDWTNLRIVGNEVHAGRGALLVLDDRADENVTVTWRPLIAIPPEGLRLRCWFRTAVPGHRFLVSLNHYDANRKWMSGLNTDEILRGSGVWQEIDHHLRDFPPGARYVRIHIRAATWTEAGEKTGLVWFDDVSVTDPATGREFIEGGDFEPRPRTEPVASPEELRVVFDFTGWDRAMERAVEVHRFNSFRLAIPGLGGGTFHAQRPPGLRGFRPEDPEYAILLDSYCGQLEDHLREKGWLDRAFVYWFDEPSPDQYAFVRAGFDRLKRACPDIARMLTEQVEPGLVGGPNVWCGLTSRYDAGRAAERRRHGERFWWYVCTEPKAPHAGLFLDHPAPEMRIWLWQTFKRGIEGILVWQTNYWTSPAAYPATARPQNPYEDPMSWMSGYDTPAGKRTPWGNGDGRFLYPPLAAVGTDRAGEEPVLDGPVDSIRWEHLRDGIEDYEYLCMLRRLLEAKGERLSGPERLRYAGLLEVPESITRSLTDFAPDGAPIEKRRHQIARVIEALR